MLSRRRAPRRWHAAFTRLKSAFPAAAGSTAAPLAAATTRVNPPMNMHEPWTAPTLNEMSNAVDYKAVSPRHWEPRGAWSAEQLRDAQDAHVMATWGPTNAIANVPTIVRGEGVYIYDSEGKRYYDWTSNAICNNLGHSVPPAVLSAITEQLETVAHVYGGLGMVDVRCRLSALLAELLPGDHPPAPPCPPANRFFRISA